MGASDQYGSGKRSGGHRLKESLDGGGPIPDDQVDPGDPAICHKRDETIRGHVFCSFLALLLKADLEQRLRERDESWEWKEIVRGLENLQEVEAVFQGRRFFLPSLGRVKN